MEVSDLTKKFGNFTAVDGISFSVKKGEIVGLLGPNGAGKTTTLSMILGNIIPTSGEIVAFGKNFKSHREEILQKMNYSSAYVRAPWRLKVWEHIYVFALLYQVNNPRKKVETLLETFALSKHKDTFTGDLSAGNIARLNLCKAFINDPGIILLDEPTSSLDPEIADRVRKFILKSSKEFGTTVVITSHNMAEIEELCDRVIFVNHGKIVAEDTPKGLAKKITKSQLRMRFDDDIKKVNTFLEKRKCIFDQDDKYFTIKIEEIEIADLLLSLSKSGLTYTEISVDKPNLEDYFIKEARKDE